MMVMLMIMEREQDLPCLLHNLGNKSVLLLSHWSTIFELSLQVSKRKDPRCKLYSYGSKKGSRCKLCPYWSKKNTFEVKVKDQHSVFFL